MHKQHLPAKLGALLHPAPLQRLHHFLLPCLHVVQLALKQGSVLLWHFAALKTAGALQAADMPSSESLKATVKLMLPFMAL